VYKISSALFMEKIPSRLLASIKAGGASRTTTRGVLLPAPLLTNRVHRLWVFV